MERKEQMHLGIMALFCFSCGEKCMSFQIGNQEIAYTEEPHSGQNGGPGKRPAKHSFQMASECQGGARSGSVALIPRSNLIPGFSKWRIKERQKDVISGEERERRKGGKKEGRKERGREEEEGGRKEGRERRKEQKKDPREGHDHFHESYPWKDKPLPARKGRQWAAAPDRIPLGLTSGFPTASG
jgi:hypothetical protein